ncbi:hypothetical protein B0T24DRAFT_591361 [Lasiosphaeria ovina]|uniref:Uncharacterized protein n=1 Tax=Lasiosphaeria ovina TaxID=92902 RepID=A0AAE0N9F6_9PEZI|nr:hypothetical protein B0T24DRAFT_591361 [Lasiosphaeria ovina]
MVLQLRYLLIQARLLEVELAVYDRRAAAQAREREVLAAAVAAARAAAAAFSVCPPSFGPYVWISAAAADSWAFIPSCSCPAPANMADAADGPLDGPASPPPPPPVLTPETGKHPLPIARGDGPVPVLGRQTQSAAEAYHSQRPGESVGRRSDAAEAVEAAAAAAAVMTALSQETAASAVLKEKDIIWGRVRWYYPAALTNFVAVL